MFKYVEVGHVGCAHSTIGVLRVEVDVTALRKPAEVGENRGHAMCLVQGVCGDVCAYSPAPDERRIVRALAQ